MNPEEDFYTLCVYHCLPAWETHWANKTRLSNFAGPLQGCLGVLWAVGVVGLILGLLGQLLAATGKPGKVWKDVKRCADSTWFKRWLKVGQIFCSFQFPFRFGTFPADIPLQVHKAFVMPHARFTQAIQRWRSQLERLPRSSFNLQNRESVSPVATFCSPNVAEYSV
jgi:hypothetical protein